jgi:hypothetical protein
LGGDDPKRTLLLDALRLGDGDSALFPCFHISILLQGTQLVNPRRYDLTYIPVRYSMVLCQKSAYGATVANGANTNGSPVTRSKSRGFAPSVRAHTGIRPAAHSVRWAA